MRVESIAATRVDAEFLKFALLPAPGQIRHQNSLLAGVEYLFDLSTPRRKVIYVPFHQINFQEDQRHVSKTNGNLVFESTIKPVYTGIIGYFEAHREILLDLEKGELRYNVDGKDYYDLHALQNNSTYYVKVQGPTNHFDGYHFGMICRVIQKPSKPTEKL